MKAFLFCLCALVLWTSCVSDGEEKGRTRIDTAADFSSSSWSDFMNTSPVGNTPVFFAAASRMSDREAEFDVCLANAAIQASKYIAVQAASFFVVNENNRDLFYLEGLDIGYDVALAEELVGSLRVVRELQDRNGSYILATLDGYSRPPIPYSPSRGGGAPTWVKDFPVIDGHYVGVGVTQRAGRFEKSLSDADDRALEEIIRQISVSQFTDRRDIEVDTVGTAFAQKRREVSEAVVLGFYVLARWISPDGSNYYSLAVCPRAQNTGKNQ